MIAKNTLIHRLAGLCFALPVASLTAQVNMVTSNLTMDLTYVGGYYNDFTDLDEFDFELYIGESYEGQSFGSSQAFSTGTRTHSMQINGSTPDFSEYDVFLNQGDTINYGLSASASAGAGDYNSGRLFLETGIYGYFYGDNSSYSSYTLKFTYNWSWDATYTEFEDPSGVTLASLLLGYEASSYEGTYYSDTNYAEIAGQGDPEDTIHIGIGGSLVDGTPHTISETGTGEIYLTFNLGEDTYDGEVELYFYNEVEAYAAMDEEIGVIPEASIAWFSACIGLIPLLRRRR